MPSFDIQSLYNFRPARYQCQKCLALLREAIGEIVKPDKGTAICPVCSVEYLPTKDFALYQLPDYLSWQALQIKFENLLQHCHQLAEAAHFIGPNVWSLPPLSALFMALGRAQQFVHFTTFGISYVIIGALKVIAQRVPVRGSVSNVSGDTLAEPKDFANEAPPGHFEIRVCAFDSAGKGMPHQKLVVI